MDIAKKPRLEGEGEGMEMGLNPMLQPPVLRGLFSNCGITELKKLRLVSRMYHHDSLEHWVQLSPTVTLRSLSEIEMLSQIVPTVDDPSWPGWHKKYELISVSLSDGDWDRMASFWEQCTSWMTHLTLTDCTLGMRTLRKLIFCENTPVLESLQLSFELSLDQADKFHHQNTLETEAALRWADHVMNRENQLLPREIQFAGWRWPSLDEHYRKLEEGQRNNPKKVIFPRLTKLRIETVHRKEMDVPVCWVELMSQYPKLKSFHLHIKPDPEEVASDDYDPEGDGLNRGLRSLVSLRQADPTRLQLTEFGLVCPKTASVTPQPVYGLFRRAQLPLDTLKIQVLPTCTPQEFYNCLRIHSTVPLKSLNLVASDSIAVPYLMIPGLKCPAIKSVLELNIQGNIFGDMKFLRSFVRLERLTLAGIADLGEMMDREDAWVKRRILLPDLQKVKVDNAVSLNAPGIIRFSTISPNLKSMEMSLVSKDALEQVCEVWPKLEKLSFSMGGANLMKMTNDIGKMKALHHLEIRIVSFCSEADDDEARMMDNLILNGILQLDQLKFLSLALPESASPLISDETMTALWKKVATVRISSDGIPISTLTENVL